MPWPARPRRGPPRNDRAQSVAARARAATAAVQTKPSRSTGIRCAAPPARRRAWPRSRARPGRGNLERISCSRMMGASSTAAALREKPASSTPVPRPTQCPPPPPNNAAARPPPRWCCRFPSRRRREVGGRARPCRATASAAINALRHSRRGVKFAVGRSRSSGTDARLGAHRPARAD